jgi:hypothetical protein
MAKYDKIFSTEKTSEESLSPEEAVAAIAVVTAGADSSLDEIDVELLADTLWGFEIFEEYSDDELLEMLDKLIAIAEDDGLGALYKTASNSLSEELVLDAFAAGVSVLVDEEELRIPKGKANLLKKLQQALKIDDEEAKDIIDDVLAAFEEAQDEDFFEDEDEDETALEEDSDLQVYKSPQGNFAVLIPVDTQEGGRVDAQEGLVSFSDDFGTLLRIDYYPLSPQQAQESSSLGKEKFLHSLLVERYVPQAIVVNLPNTKVEYTEYLPETMQGAYFVVINMPEGATISRREENGTATRLNAYRGLLGFMEGEFLYVVSSQRNFSPGETPGSIEQEAESIKDNLLNFVDTIEFM